jgi:hypothetical protein
LSVASKRRQGGKVETHSDLVMGREFGELEEVVIAVVGGERDQKQQGAGKQGRKSLAIQPTGPGRQIEPLWRIFSQHQRNEGTSGLINK